MAILADLTAARVHRRLPKPFYIRREDDPQAMDVHSGSQQLARSRANDDAILPRQATLRLEAAIEAIPGARPRVVDRDDTSVLKREPAPMRPSPIVTTKFAVGPDLGVSRLAIPIEQRRPRPRRMYQMQPGSEEGPLYVVVERATGLVLGRCQGVHEHVRREAEKLAVSQGSTLAEVKIEVEA